MVSAEHNNNCNRNNYIKCLDAEVISTVVLKSEAPLKPNMSGTFHPIISRLRPDRHNLRAPGVMKTLTLAYIRKPISIIRDDEQYAMQYSAV